MHEQQRERPHERRPIDLYAVAHLDDAREPDEQIRDAEAEHDRNQHGQVGKVIHSQGLSIDIEGMLVVLPIL